MLSSIYQKPYLEISHYRELHVTNKCRGRFAFVDIIILTKAMWLNET
jgi:hypothetical protein